MEQKTHTELVKTFTEESLDAQLRKTPCCMDKGEVKYIVRMVLSEMLELCMTVHSNAAETEAFFKECCDSLDRPKDQDWTLKSEVEVMAEQYDSFVDAWYYMLNTAVKKGVDLDRIFHVVHEANMAKRFPDGKFRRREDGKVVKPEGWKEPNIVGEIENQMGLI
jgi:predicted HAD superfamily Cof-like phosphohydrolase